MIGPMSLLEWLLTDRVRTVWLIMAIATFILIMIAIAQVFSNSLVPMNDTQELEAFGEDYFNCSHNGTRCENITDYRLKANAQCAYYNRVQTNNTSCWT
jgi:hypothetical protein